MRLEIELTTDGFAFAGLVKDRSFIYFRFDDRIMEEDAPPVLSLNDGTVLLMLCRDGYEDKKFSCVCRRVYNEATDT